MKKLFLLALCALALQAFGAEVEIKTTKDEVIRGTVVAANEKEVSVRTDFGVIKIPRETVANPEVLTGAPETPAEAQPVKGGGRLDEKGILAARRKVQRIDRLTPQENMDITALIGKFGEALEFERAGLIEKLRAYCPKANETFRISYTRPEAIEVRTRLMPAIALRGNVGAIPIIEETHESVMTAFDDKIREEPDKQSWFDRGAQRVLTKKEIEKQAKAIAELAPELENNAAEVGGAGAVLFLMKVYRQRYTPEQKSFFYNRDRDLIVFLYAATDDPEAARNGKPVRLGETWTPEERALAIEKLLPELQTPSKNYRRFVEAMLAVLLPPEHPAFNAAEAEWQAWWNLARPVVLKTPLRPMEPDSAEISTPK